MQSVNHERLLAYRALLQRSSDPTIMKQIGARVTVPRVELDRVRDYRQRVTTYLMYRDLASYGDL